jgi:hypothetical protein
MNNDLRKTALIISIVLFLLSLTQPAYYIGRSDYDGWSNSLELLVFGWSGVLYGGAAIAWLANPLIFLSWIVSFKKPQIALISSLFASFFSASFLFFTKVISSEKPDYCIITDRKAGYWLWLASILFFSVFNGCIYILERPLVKGEILNN